MDPTTNSASGVSVLGCSHVLPPRKLHPIDPYTTTVHTHYEYPTLAASLRSYFTSTNSFVNAPLAECIFQEDSRETLRLLRERVWPPNVDAREFDALVLDVIKRPTCDTSVLHVSACIRDGTLAAHDRINTFEKLCDIVRDLEGPSLQHAMTHSRAELEKSHVNMAPLPLDSAERLEEQLTLGINLFYGAKHPLEDEDEEEDEDEDESEEKEEEQQKVQMQFDPMSLWTSSNDAERTHWYRTVVARALYEAYAQFTRNTRNVFLKQKANAFINGGNNHGSDQHTNFSDDYNATQVKSTLVQVRPEPLQVLQRDLPDLAWTVEDATAAAVKVEAVAYLHDEWAPLHPPPSPETHRLYYACVSILNTCRTQLLAHEQGSPLYDALWAHYCSHLNLFQYALGGGDVVERFSDKHLLMPMDSKVGRSGDLQVSAHPSPWELHGPTHALAFHAGDLPDLFHVLVSIPLSGEQDPPPYRIGKIYQKSLPFACQRRHLIKLIVETIRESDAFWRVFSQLFWCMLSGLYPGKLGLRDPSLLGMRELLRIKQLCDSQDLLIDAIQSRESGAPLVVFVAFRLHILYMAEQNSRTYIEYARKHIDWEYFERNTIELAHLIRSQNLFPQDCFAQARKQLSRTVKSPSAKVHRLRKASLSLCLRNLMNETLEKTLIQDKYNRSESVAAQEYYKRLLALPCKAAILNMLIRIPCGERWSVEALSLMTLPEFGAVDEEAVALMYNLVQVYEESAQPKDFRRHIDAMKVRSFVVYCFYANMVALLDRINFIQLDADTVRRTDEAMLNTRYHLYPGQPLPSSVYNVSVALCCKKICNLTGQGKYGNEKVAYNVERGVFVCAHGKTTEKKKRKQQQKKLAEQQYSAAPPAVVLPNIDDLISDASKFNGRGVANVKEMTQRKIIRNERKAFTRIPCGQPVLSVNLRGRALIWGNSLGQGAKRQYMFCPECGALHEYSVLNFSGAEFGHYRCGECARKQLHTHQVYAMCAYCERALPQPSDQRRLQVDLDLLYFCKVHYKIARRYASGLERDALWKRIRTIEEKRIVERARKYQ